MLHQFYPDYEADSAYGIDYRTLYEQGYRGIIFDIDNTLVPHGAPATPVSYTHLDVYKRQLFTLMGQVFHNNYTDGIRELRCV